MYPIEFFWRAVQRHPDRAAVIAPGNELTFRELARRVEGRAAAIAGPVSTRDGFVCVGAANSSDHLITILAVLAAGKTWIPLNPRSGDPELKRIIDFTEPELVLLDGEMMDRVDAGGRTVRLLTELGDSSGAIPMGPRPSTAFPLDRTQAVKFTGGTTGFPKGVKQPLRAWNANIATQIHALQLAPDDRYLVAAPLTHGTSTYMLPILGSGGALIFPESSKPEGLLEAAERYRATIFFAPPTLVLALVVAQTRYRRDLGALRYLVYGGAPMRPDQIREAQGCFGPILCTSFGQTEAPQIATYLSPDEMVGGHLASVGRPTFMTQVGILDSDGLPLPAGAEGEIALRGDLVMTGYLKAPKEAEKTFRDGWLLTGDAGAFDERGYLFIKDRIRDVIITGGFNVYPSDVEVVLSAHPAIADCSVIGIADDKWGEAVHAAVEIRPGATLQVAEVKSMLKRELGSVKTPKAIHVFESLPRSPVGKVLKVAIREEIVRRSQGNAPGGSR